MSGTRRGIWHAEMAWLGRVAANVSIEVEDGRITHLFEDTSPPAGAFRLDGLTVPGLVNAHSHVFHRALRGRTHQGRDSFWEWRDLMYEIAARLEPDTLHQLATAVFAEMALAGVTAVGEFHYVHHRPDGGRYSDPNEMGLAVTEAARRAGVRLTLLDTLYLRGGFDEPLGDHQLRFSDGDFDSWRSRVAGLTENDRVRVGAAIHSVRAVDGDSAADLAVWSRQAGTPLHVHVSEQPAENESALAATGLTPTGILDRASALGRGTTLVHATHLTHEDIDLVGASHSLVCLCPTTERDLADGMAPAAALVTAGASLCVGSDSHAVIDLLEEARLVELHQRLQTGRRGHHATAELWSAATLNGMTSLGWPDSGLAPGGPADFTTFRLDSRRLAGWDQRGVADAVLHAATAEDVTDVVVGGQAVVREGDHVELGDVAGLLGEAIAQILPNQASAT